MVEEWALVNREKIADYYIFDVDKTVKKSPRTGKEHTFFVLDSPDWVNVIPVTADDNVVMIRQIRHGIDAPVLEIPGGMVDDEDGDPAAAAARELLEETGYTADRFIRIGSVTPNPAFLNNRLFTYLALNAHQVQQPEFDGSEDIEVEEIPRDQIPTLIAGGKIHHALVVAAFYHLERFREQQQP